MLLTSLSQAAERGNTSPFGTLQVLAHSATLAVSMSSAVTGRPTFRIRLTMLHGRRSNSFSWKMPSGRARFVLARKARLTGSGTVDRMVMLISPGVATVAETQWRRDSGKSNLRDVDQHHCRRAGGCSPPLFFWPMFPAAAPADRCPRHGAGGLKFSRVRCCLCPASGVADG